MAALSEKGRLLLFPIAELKYQPRGRGMIVMGLDDGDRLRAVAVSDVPRLLVRGTTRGGKQKEVELGQTDLAHYVLKRARMGRVLPVKPPVTIAVAAKSA